MPDTGDAAGQTRQRDSVILPSGTIVDAVAEPRAVVPPGAALNELARIVGGQDPRRSSFRREIDGRRSVAPPTGDAGQEGVRPR